MCPSRGRAGNPRSLNLGRGSRQRTPGLGWARRHPLGWRRLEAGRGHCGRLEPAWHRTGHRHGSGHGVTHEHFPQSQRRSDQRLNQPHCLADDRFKHRRILAAKSLWHAWLGSFRTNDHIDLNLDRSRRALRWTGRRTPRIRRTCRHRHTRCGSRTWYRDIDLHGPHHRLGTRLRFAGVDSGLISLKSRLSDLTEADTVCSEKHENNTYPYADTYHGIPLHHRGRWRETMLLSHA
jgi:hypothetical protein